MAVHELMHPRNRYRKRPNIQELAKEFPVLNQVATVDVNGRVKLDYKNAQTLHLLSKCLLLRDFGLNLQLPAGKLVPTLPLRLNYIHWLEDIGAGVGWDKQEIVKGIDIGCGASCIYPLLAVVQSKRRWHMLAIEKATDSLQVAQENVARNNMKAFIDVRPQAASGQTILLEALQSTETDERFEFCMCNPPFYDSAIGVKSQNRTGKRREPSNVSTGSGEELCTEGGEVKFISQIIQESVQLKDRISVYTTMIGHKKSYEEILTILKQASISNIAATRFGQGNTIRWAVAWTFDDRMPLNDLSNDTVTNGSPASAKRKSSLHKPLEWKIWTAGDSHKVPSLNQIKLYLLTILDSISLTVRMLSETSDDIVWELMAQQNTWSHQRRKRRYNLATKDTHNEPLPKTQCIEHEDGMCQEKKPKLEHDMTAERHNDKQTEPYLKVAIKLNRRSNGFYLSLQYITGSAGKDSVNQILQFIQNSVKAKSIDEMCTGDAEVQQIAAAPAD